MSEQTASTSSERSRPSRNGIRRASGKHSVPSGREAAEVAGICNFLAILAFSGVLPAAVLDKLRGNDAWYVNALSELGATPMAAIRAEGRRDPSYNAALPKIALFQGEPEWRA